MDYKCRINGLIQRAGRIGLPIRDLCAAAGLNKSTLYRWQQDDANPRLRSMTQALDAMEAALAAREQKIVSELAREGRAA